MKNKKMRKEWIMLLGNNGSEQLPEQELNGNSSSKGIE
jgi:hypothetical protein